MKAVVQFVFMVLLVVALAEAGSYASLYALGASNKSFSEIYDPTGNTARYSGKCNDYLQTVELDPYLAFTHNKQCSDSDSYKINNLGMLNQDADLKKDKYYTIGIFGGSVAALFAGLTAIPQLEVMLNGCFDSKSGKPFKVLNFSDGSWKQPQQLIALALFGDYIDAAVSIEGFNERTLLNKGTTTDLMVPDALYSSLLQNDFFSNSYFALSRLKGSVLAKSNTIKLFTFLFRKNLEKRGFYNSYLALKDKYSIDTYVDVPTHNLKRYIGFVKSFDAVAASKNIYSLIVLQPVPLHKPLTKDEAKVVGPLDYEQTYQDIAIALENNTKAFINLTDLFRETSRPVFADNIHFIALDKHLTSYGNYRVAEEIIHKLETDKEITAKANSDACLDGYEPK
ncbi:MAG TPA: hypothetical protein VIE66_09175 [Methylocella sp.]|jgi:hypothetical protein